MSVWKREERRYTASLFGALDNAIHDLALAYRSELLSIKRSCNQNEPGEIGKSLVSILSSISVPKLSELT
jgi:hypothetical protein